MTEEQEDALFAFLAGLAVTNVDLEAWDAVLVAFGREHPHATTAAAYENAAAPPPPPVVPVDAEVLAGAEVERGTGVKAPETAERHAGGKLYSRVGTDVQYLAEESPDGQITVTAVGSDVRETVSAAVWASEFKPV